MAAELPTIPWAVFTRFEPLSLLAGFLGPILAPKYFITSQIPFTYSSIQQSTILSEIVAKDATATLLAWQLGNAYLLLGLLGTFILNTTKEIEVVNAYLWALWIGDIGHVGLTLYAMGWHGTMNVGAWNAVVWGNIAFTTFLFLTRSAYFLGWFNESQAIEEQPKIRADHKARKE
ncbi:hypothetical protein BT63DRAFT_420218 [Microthyrium microscopicum]|uniref:DUF7704 domain-containing protein n=1 Tax=Microthyrium microscopicum TaxID=703497 RepID=A0A6A6URM3_9PEZI|nr:hypothetical protein BT63DRAFT_420218 [Microthyrium microscopicum]